MEELPDQRLDPAQGPPLLPGEPVRRRALAQLEFQPGPLLRAQPLPRHRPPGPQRRGPAIPPGLTPPPHRPLRDPQVRGDRRGAVPAPPPLPPVSPRAGASPRGVAPGATPPPLSQPRPPPPLLLGGRIPAPL